MASRRAAQLDLVMDELFEAGEASGMRLPQTGLRPPDPADSVDEWVGERKERPKRRPRASSRAVHAYIEDAAARARTGIWDDVDGEQVGGLLAGLYVISHERVYGVRPLEVLGAEQWPQVALAAKRLHVDAFRADTVAIVEFVLWTWNRERGREQERVGKGVEARRIGWRLQFGANTPLLTDYRHAQARARRG